MRHFYRLGGDVKWRMLATRMQTDGSYIHSLKLSRIACWIPEAKQGWLTTYSDNEHRDSMESEWCSIVDALDKEIPLLNIENDCQGVINSLILKKKPRKDYLREYYWEILERAGQMEWLGICWIPRELNRADDLFRKNALVLS